MGRKNPDRYSDADWHFAGSTVGAIIANRWLVYTECDLCHLRIEADGLDPRFSSRENSAENSHVP